MSSFGSFSDSMPVCATCRYWCGKRDINFSFTVFEALEDSGKCCGVHSASFRGLDTWPSGSCMGWEGFRSE